MSQKEIEAICLRLLARREHSQYELLTKLLKKSFEKIEIQSVIAKLNEKGFQSDTRFAESYARMRFNSGFGSLKIQYELKQRGIDEFDLQPVLTENFTDEQTLINQVYQKKYTNTVEITMKERLKHQRFLQQRGFSYALIQNLFKD